MQAVHQARPLPHHGLHVSRISGSASSQERGTKSQPSIGPPAKGGRPAEGSQRRPTTSLPIQAASLQSRPSTARCTASASDQGNPDQRRRRNGEGAGGKVKRQSGLIGFVIKTVFHFIPLMPAERLSARYVRTPAKGKPEGHGEFK